jgi:hypothetical protein
MKTDMKHIKIFEEIEPKSSKSYHKFDFDTIEDICIDLIDEGWEIKDFMAKFYKEEDFDSSSRIGQNFKIPGYFFKIENEKLRIPMFNYSAQMKEWITNLPKIYGSVYSVIKKLESQVGPIQFLLGTDAADIRIWLKEKSEISVSEEDVSFGEFCHLLKSLAEHTFYSWEINISTDQESLTLTLDFTDRLNKNRYYTFTNRLEVLKTGIGLREHIPQSHRRSYIGLNKFKYEILTKSKSKFVLKMIGKKE